VGKPEEKRTIRRARLSYEVKVNPLNAKLNPICHFLASLGAHHIFHVSGVRVKNESARNVMRSRGLD